MRFSSCLLLASTVAVSATISGDLSDTALCGGSIIHVACSFEANPDRRRDLQGEGQRKRRTTHTRGGARMVAKEVEDPGADGFLNDCTVTLDGVELNITITDLDYALLTYDEDLKGDDTNLELFQSLVKVEDSTIMGLFKLEAFEYDDPDSDKAEDTITTLKTFSVAWSGCS